jgi:GNAT superfamily N-acetyltransferase
MAVEVREARDDVDCVLVHGAYMMMHAEGGIPGRVDAQMAMEKVFRWRDGPGSVIFMAMDDDELVGILSVTEAKYWWNGDPFLEDKGFYVLPEYRGGEAGGLLLKAARDLSDGVGQDCYITIMNGLRQRGARSDWERAGFTIGYHPRGAVLVHRPEGK